MDSHEFPRVLGKVGCVPTQYLTQPTQVMCRPTRRRGSPSRIKHSVPVAEAQKVDALNRQQRVPVWRLTIVFSFCTPRSLRLLFCATERWASRGDYGVNCTSRDIASLRISARFEEVSYPAPKDQVPRSAVDASYLHQAIQQREGRDFPLYRVQDLDMLGWHLWPACELDGARGSVEARRPNTAHLPQPHGTPIRSLRDESSSQANFA